VFLTHYTGLFFLAGVGAGWLAIELKQGRARTPLVWGLGTGVLISAWIPIMLAQRSTKLSMGDVRGAALGIDPEVARAFEPVGWFVWFVDLVVNYASIIGVYPASNIILLLALAAPFVLTLFIGLVSVVRLESSSTISLAVIVTLAAGTVVLGGVVERRYVLLAAPAAFILLGQGLEVLVQLGRRRVAVAFTACILATIGAGALRTVTGQYGAPIRTVVMAVKDLSNEGDLLLFNSAYGQVPFDYHAARLDLRREETGFPEPIYQWWREQSFKGWGTHPVTREEVARFVNALPRGDVWLLDFESGRQDPHGELLSELRAVREVREMTPALSVPPKFRLFRARSVGEG
jgi:hypothetical protein